MISALTAASTKLTMAATTAFEGSGIVVLKAHTFAVIIKAKADAGHPANTRKPAPAESATPIRIAFCRAKKNSLRCGNRTSRAGSLPSRTDKSPSSSWLMDSTQRRAC